MVDVSLIPEHFVEKLFNQVKESSDKNSDAVDKLTERISKLTEVIKDVKSKDIPQINEKCNSIINISNTIKNENLNIVEFLSSYKNGLQKMNDFESESFKKEREESLRILRWLSLKFKIVISIITLFFLLTGGSYVIVKYFNSDKNSKIIEAVREENKKTLECIKEENKKIQIQIKNENLKFRKEIIKNIKVFHPDFDIRMDK